MEVRTESSTDVDMSPSLYDQEEKGEVRKKVIEHAVRSLTTERSTSACVQRNYPRDFWNQLLAAASENHWSPEQIQSIEKRLEQWELYHDSKILAKKPSDLLVCSVAGDDPTRDLQVLTDNGVLPQNIWLVEKETKNFEKATKAVMNSPFRGVKLVKDNLLTFLEEDRAKAFDIIYYDACGTLPAASQKTLKVIGSIFQLNKLASPGALITNFSFPPKQLTECEERKQIAYIAEEYLKSKTKDINGCYHENFFSQKTDEQNYSDYITFQVIDSASLLIPAQRMLLSSKLWGQIFTPKNTFFDEVRKHPPHIVGSTCEGPLERSATRSEQDSGLQRNMGSKDCEDLYNSFYLSKISVAMEVKKESNLRCKAWVNEVFPSLPGDSQKEKVSSLVLTALLFSSFNFFSKFANSNFKECIASSICSEDKSLIAGLLYGLSAEPSYPVLDKLLRLYYTARQRQMFSDVFIFDRCRYLFELFPTVYTVKQFCDDENNDFLISKMVLDGMKKHLKCICKKDFFNVNLRCQFGVDETDAIDKELPLPEREEIRVE